MSASESPLPWSQKVKTKSLNSVKYGVFGNRDKDGKWQVQFKIINNIKIYNQGLYASSSLSAH